MAPTIQCVLIRNVTMIDQTYNSEASWASPLKHTRGPPDSLDLPSYTPQIPRTPRRGAPPPAPGHGMSEFRSLTEQVPRELNSLHDRALPLAHPGRGASARASLLLIGMTLVGPIYYSQNTYIFTDLVYRKAFPGGACGQQCTRRPIRIFSLCSLFMDHRRSLNLWSSSTQIIVDLRIWVIVDPRPSSA